MIPGEAAPAPESPEKAWLDLGSALARAVSALDAATADDLTPEQREHAVRARAEVLNALEEHRDANRRLRDLLP
jgi:hypothetical protein